MKIPKSFTDTPKRRMEIEMLNYEYAHNQPADPITEEALRGKYEIWNDYEGANYSFLEIEIKDGLYVHVNINSGKLYNVSVWADDGDCNGLVLSECKTMQDIETLIRLLGGVQE